MVGVGFVEEAILLLFEVENGGSFSMVSGDLLLPVEEEEEEERNVL